MKLSFAEKSFQKVIREYYRAHGRSMPWRNKPTPYYVVVSEIMLQQTQVGRVTEKFNSFIRKFPDWRALAKAPVKSVLKEWSGLGYNRRALYLKGIAEKVIRDEEYSFLRMDISYMTYRYTIYDISLQEKRATLLTTLLALPGIGPNTAGSILAFAFNQSVTFIETNIRSVYIHFFFKGSQKKVSDAELLPLIEKTLDRKNPREWYYALMDYGAYLKSITANPSRKSVHHVKQKPFKGSNRELRSKILQLSMKTSRNHETIAKRLGLNGYARSDIMRNIRDLKKEGFPL